MKLTLIFGRKMERAYNYVRILSLDVVVGACAGAIFLLKLMSLEIAWDVILTLGLAVWFIYTADHLADAMRAGTSTRSARHRFHFRYRSTLTVLWALVGAAGLATAFLLPRQVIFSGLGLIVLVGFYLLFTSLFPPAHKIQKELAGAFLYVAGIAVPVCGAAQFILPLWFFGILLLYLLLAFYNLLLFALIEKADDQAAGYSSFVIEKGARVAEMTLLWTFTVFILILTILLSLGDPNPLNLIGLGILALMMMMLVAVNRFSANLIGHERYRVLGDAVFILPILIVLF